MSKRKKPRAPRKVFGNPAKQAEYEKTVQIENQKPKVPLPPFITCNECGGEAPKSTFEMLDTSGIDDIHVAFIGTCEDCGSPTFAASGDPLAVSAAMSLLMEEFGGSKMGMDAFK